MINIAFIIDDSYLNNFLLALSSIIEIHHSGSKCCFYIFYMDIHKNKRQEIKDRILSSGHYCVFLGLPFKVRHLPDFAIDKKIYYSRLFLGSALPKLSQVIYLDADIIVCRDLIALWEFPLKNKLIAATLEPNVLHWTTNSTQGTYFNAGVLLIDLQKWRKNKIEEKMISALIDLKSNPYFYDQDLLNILTEENIVPLPYKFNFLCFKTLFRTYIYMTISKRQVEYIEAKRAPVIIHFFNAGFTPKPPSVLYFGPYRKNMLSFCHCLDRENISQVSLYNQIFISLLLTLLINLKTIIVYLVINFFYIVIKNTVLRNKIIVNVFKFAQGNGKHTTCKLQLK